MQSGQQPHHKTNNLDILREFCTDKPCGLIPSGWTAAPKVWPPSPYQDSVPMSPGPTWKETETSCFTTPDLGVVSPVACSFGAPTAARVVRSTTEEEESKTQPIAMALACGSGAFNMALPPPAPFATAVPTQPVALELTESGEPVPIYDWDAHVQMMVNDTVGETLRTGECMHSVQSRRTQELRCDALNNKPMTYSFTLTHGKVRAL